MGAGVGFGGADAAGRSSAGGVTGGVTGGAMGGTVGASCAAIRAGSGEGSGRGAAAGRAASAPRAACVPERVTVAVSRRIADRLAAGTREKRSVFRFDTTVSISVRSRRRREALKREIQTGPAGTTRWRRSHAAVEERDWELLSGAIRGNMRGERGNCT
jgi:hypothetical protein